MTNPAILDASPSFRASYKNFRNTLYKGKRFTILARNNSPANMYIQSATLNGKPLTRTWLTHDQIAAGGTLVLQMGATPNRSWGAGLADRPK